MSYESDCDGGERIDRREEIERLTELLAQEQSNARTFARAADTEKAEAKHWREYAEKLEAAIRECEGDGGCRATKAKVRYGTRCPAGVLGCDGANHLADQCKIHGSGL